MTARPVPGRGPDPQGPMAVGKATAFLKLLAHEGRLEILCLLLDAERTVGELARDMGLTQPAVSQHLMRLRAEELVVARREGKCIRYGLCRPETVVVVQALRQAFCPGGHVTAHGAPAPGRA